MLRKWKSSRTAPWPFYLGPFYFFFPVFFLLCSSCTGVFYQPDRFMHYPPEKFGFKKTEMSFKSKDGTKLIGWVFEPTTAPVKGTIVQFHGNGENLSSHYLFLVWLTRYGYRLFTFDYRGYGGSEGKATADGVYEDSLAALAEGWKLHGEGTRKGEKFIVVGQSLGGTIALRALQDFASRPQMSNLELDSSFLSYHAMARKKLQGSWITWLFSPLGSVLVSDKYSAEDSLAAQKGKLLVIHDRRDEVVPFEFGQEIFDRATCPKDFWILDQGRHIGVFSEDNVTERKKFVDYLASP